MRRERILAADPKQAIRLVLSFSFCLAFPLYNSTAINLSHLYDRFKIIPRSGVHLVKDLNPWRFNRMELLCLLVGPPFPKIPPRATFYSLFHKYIIRKKFTTRMFNKIRQYNREKEELLLLNKIIWMNSLFVQLFVRSVTQLHWNTTNVIAELIRQLSSY